MAPLTFAVLGPLEVRRDGAPVVIAATRQRVLLAALLLEANRLVTVDRLVDVVWSGDEPATARQTVVNYVRRLRVCLGDPVLSDTRDRAPIVTCPGGYRLCVAADDLDLLTFTALLRQARAASRAGTVEAAAGLYRRALACWRGDPLADLAGHRSLQAEISLMVDLRITASEELADLELLAGQGIDAVERLTTLVGRWPLRESLRARLIRALHACGRTADALREYRVSRDLLVHELGVEPGQLLRDAQRAVLTSLPQYGGGSCGGGFVPAPPEQLPPPVTAFTGRGRELAVLDALRDTATYTRAGVLVVAISGTAGVGKTALAVHWARQVANRFPDGQMYVNLRGFDPARAPMEPAEALRGLLAALGVPADRIPGDPSTQAGLYRTVLAGRRVLVLLDNARSAEQVRPLLPATSDCVALVTSRDHLAALGATDGAHPVRLDLFTDAEAQELLTGRLGHDRTGAEPDAVLRIVAGCARLPLALSLAAALVAARPERPLARMADELTNSASILDVLRSGDPATDVRAVFSWSIPSLQPAAARLFRLLGLHPGPVASIAAAASLAGVSEHRAGMLLADLARAHLLTELTPGWYAQHDLLKAFARELAEQAGPAECDEALHRLLDHYLYTAQAISGVLYPSRYDLALTGAVAGVTVQSPAGAREAVAWLAAEHAGLSAVVDLAAASDRFTGHAWRLAHIVTRYLLERFLWWDLAGMHEAALAAAKRTADRCGQAHAHHGLGRTQLCLGLLPAAQAHLREALDVFTELADQTSQARVHLGFAVLLTQQGAHARALDQAHRSLSLHRAAADWIQQADALNVIGWAQAHLGNLRGALAACQEALDLYQRVGIQDGQADVWDSLGFIHRAMGAYDQAVDCYTAAAALARELRPVHHAECLAQVGDIQHAAGHADAAREAWRDALGLFEDLGHPDAAALRAKLRGRRERR